MIHIYNTMSNISIKNCPAFDQYAYRLALEAPSGSILNEIIPAIENIMDNSQQTPTNKI